MLMTIFLSLAMSTALAQSTDQATTVYKKRTDIDFGDLEIIGSLQGPDDALITEVKRPKFNPLIQLRGDFKLEMTSSINDIR